ncbi:MAG TPA: tetratricopeptide repeat protein [Pyrinomonadaceae bacterium]|nr:tetratricopeptide repeat protein [Pyrinomonadaceae bacterium]
MRNAQVNFTVRPLAIVFMLFYAVLTPAFAGPQVKTTAEQLERVASLISANQLVEAEQQLNQILRVAPNDATALNFFGTLRAKQGRLKEAEGFFLRAVGADNNLIGARMNLAYLYLLRREPDKTAAELKKVLSLDPANADAAYRLAWVLFSQGRYDECIAVVAKVKESQTLSAPMLAVLGDAYLRKGDAIKAEESYLLALDLQSNNADALLGLAQLWQTKGDIKMAVAYVDRASSLTNSPDLLYKLARVSLDLNLREQAVVALQRAVALRADEPSYHFALGTAWLKQPPDLHGAEQSFKQFLKLKPDDAQGQVHLGYVLLKQKKQAEARTWLLKSVRDGVGTPEAFYYLGLIAQAQNEDAQAIQLFQKSVQLAPSFASAHVALGSTYLKLKDYPRAQQALETGVKLSPDDSKAHYNLAMLYARLKNTEKAQEEMRIVARLKSQGKEQDDGESLAPPPPR